MRVGIITFHRAHNLGAVLQSFALCKYINSDICDAELIDFYPNNSISNRHSVVHKIVHIGKSILLIKKTKKTKTRLRKINLFCEQYKVSKERYFGDAQILSNPPKYDLLISGGDQILNTTLSGCSKSYYLFFDDMTPKISYSSSFGRDTISDDEKKLIVSELSKFKALSFREESGANLVKKLTGRDSMVVMDPVFLIDKSIWEDYCDTSNHNKFIFVYAMENTKELRDTVHKIQNLYDLPTIIVNGGGDRLDIAGIKDEVCGPNDFLSYIRNAEIVITNSFHGTVFSFIFNKKVCVVAHSKRNARLENILEMAKVEDKLIGWNTEFKESMIIHGEFAYQNLKVYIEDSKQYLRKVVLNTGETGNSNNKEDSLIRKGIDSVVKNRKCAGCEACVQVCPQNAIVFEQGLDSFLYPKVLNEKCMNCGLCTKTCPALNEKLASGEEHKVYACRHKSKDIVSLSTSGGIFSAISDWFLNQSGVVYGAVFNDKFQVVMKRATTVYDRDSMRGAKYVQCRVNDSFKQVESDLKKDKRVLFSGTPCQIAGLKQYLQVKRIDCEKLLTVDIFCHGVSPQYMFDQHIKELIDKYGEINEYRFRCKEAGWRGHNVKVSFKNGRSHLNDAVSNGYAGLYFKSLLMRSSCKQCKYASIDRRGDFSIGDFWGIERVNSQFDDNEGCSCVMINSTKGMKCFDAIKGNIMFEEHSLQECKQEALTKPVSESLRIDNFRNDLEKKGYAYCQRKYTDLSYYGKVSDIVYRMQYHFNRLSG